MIKFSGTITYQYNTPFAPFTADEYEKALDWAKTSRFDGVEICISNYNGVDVNKIKKDLDQRGLECSTISTGQSRTLEGISLIHDDPEIRRKAQKRIMEHVEAAAVLGCKVTIGLLRGLGEISRLSEQKKLMAEMAAPCVEYAQGKNVKILFEAINRYETVMLNSAESVVELIEEMGNPDNVCVLWDIFHANIEDATFEGAIDLMGKKLGHVHIADSNRGFPGYGHIAFGAIYDKLKAVGYDEYMSFECLNLPSVQTVQGESGNFIDSLRSR